MKKITLLNFPHHYYEPQKKTKEMLELLDIQKGKKEQVEKAELEQLQHEKNHLEEIIRNIPIEAMILSDEVKAFEEELFSLKTEEQVQRYINKNSALYELSRLHETYHSTRHLLEKKMEEIRHMEELIHSHTPLIPLPVTQRHINYMNKEIAKRATEGLELECYQFLQTEFFNEEGHWQKCYSGVLFTWIVKTGTSSKRRRTTSRKQELQEA